MKYDPAEKNLKHQTDVLLWDEVEWTTCDLNFRPPDSLNLTMSPFHVFFLLMVASLFGAAGGMISMGTIAPLARSRSALEITVVAGIVAALVAIGFYRPLPNVFQNQRTFVISMLGAGAVWLIYSVLRFGYLQNSFAVGNFLLISVAVPSSLYVADQMAGHIIHWISADPRLDRNEMILWRNAWCGRFLTQETDHLVPLGVPSRSVRRLQKYWRSHAMVGSSCAISVAFGMIGSFQFGFRYVGIAIVVVLTSVLSMMSMATLTSTSHAHNVTRQILGHWFGYQKNDRKPPSVVQSPAGTTLLRAFMAYGTASLMACATVFLGLADSMCRSQSIADAIRASFLNSTIVLFVAVIVTPLNMILIFILVSAPVATACQTAIEEMCHEDE